LAVRVASTPGLVLEVQNMQGFAVGAWSRGEQVLGRGTNVGDFVTLKLPAPDAEARELVVSPTRAPDFGILSFTVNGRTSETRFDGYAPGVTRADAVSLGTFAPVDGGYEIRIQVSGTHPDSTGAR